MVKESQNNYLPKFVQFCWDIIRPYLKYEGKFKKNETLEIAYSLTNTTGNWSTRIGSHGQSVPIVVLNNGFYLHCSISFKEVKREKILKGISLQFFDEQRLLFRAEWDNRDFLEGKDKPHSQPHWHFDAKGEIKKVQTTKTFTDFQNVSQFDGSLPLDQDEFRQIKLERLHLFMTLEDGQKCDTSYKDLTNIIELKQWLSQCMKQVDYELKFISDK